MIRHRRVTESARATSGNGADLGKLIVAVEHLTGFMRDAKSAEPEDEEEDPNYDWTKDPDSPKYKLKAYLDLSIEAAREDERYNAAKEIDQLKARIAEQARRSRTSAPRAPSPSRHGTPQAVVFSPGGDGVRKSSEHLGAIRTRRLRRAAIADVAEPHERGCRAARRAMAGDARLWPA